MNTMKFTGERFIPEEFQPGQEIYDAHLARYQFAATFVSHKTVLDISSGEGYGSRLLADVAKEVQGVDKDGEVVNFAKNKYQKDNLNFTQGLAESLDFPSDYFDVVVSFETIEHLSQQSQNEFLTGVKKILKNNGVFIVSTPDKDIYGSDDNEFHEYELSKKEFQKILTNFFLIENMYGQQVAIQRNTIITAIRCIIDIMRNHFIWKKVKKHIPHFFKKVVNTATSKYDNQSDALENMFTVTHLPLKASAKYIVAVCKNIK